VGGQHKSTDVSSQLLVSECEEAAATWSDEVLNAVDNTPANASLLRQQPPDTGQSVVDETPTDYTFVSGLLRQRRHSEQSPGEGR